MTLPAFFYLTGMFGCGWRECRDAAVVREVSVRKLSMGGVLCALDAVDELTPFF